MNDMSSTNRMLENIMKLLDEMQALDVNGLDVTKQTTVTDFMIFCSGRSSRHVKRIAEHVIEQMKKSNHPPLSATGIEQGSWALVDFGDCILHVMQPDTRAFYNVEGLWQDIS